MHLRTTALALAAAGTAAAEGRPADMPICDYYTKALLKENTAANQYTLLTLVVNTAVIGNYTMPNVGIMVPGILAPGKFNGTDVNLLPFFNGKLESSNRGGKAGVSVNFLDGGGAEPLKMNKPASDDKSNQFTLLTHLYQFFGALLGCTMYGQDTFPPYTGAASMTSVHAFMDLNAFQVGYFIEQVALAGASFGVAQEDLVPVGMALMSLFGMRCAQPAAVIPAQGPQLQSVCLDAGCPLAENATCESYEIAVAPKNHSSGMTVTAPGGMEGTATMTMTTPMGTDMGSMTGSMTGGPTAATTNGAAVAGVGLVAMAGGLAALLL